MKIIEIKKDDIFRILSQRVQRSVKNLRYEDFDHSLFFYESVHVLRNIEFFVDAVLNMSIESRDTYEKAIKNNEKDRFEKVHEVFSGLRYHQNMLKLPNVRYSDRFNIFKKIYIDSESIHKLSMRLRMSDIIDPDELYSLNLPFFQVDGWVTALDMVWNKENFPKEKCFGGIYKIRELAEREDLFLNDKRYETLLNLQQIYQSFDQLISQLGSMYVLVLDIRFITPYQSRTVNNFQDVVLGVFQHIELIMGVFRTIPNLIQVFTKLQHDFNLGVNLHCILIFQNSPKMDEQNLIKSLQQQFDSLFFNTFQINVSNWNEVVRRNFSNKAVGHIGKGDKKRLSSLNTGF